MKLEEWRAFAVEGRESYGYVNLNIGQAQILVPEMAGRQHRGGRGTR